MAFSFFSLLLVFLFIINLSCSSDLVDKVCSRTRDEPLCTKTLRSDPRSAKADLKGLGNISIEISHAHNKKTYSYVVSLSKQAGSDPRLKDRYDTCMENYDDTIDSLVEARKALDNGDIPTFRIRSSAAFDGPVTCDDSFDGPPSAPRRLQQSNKKSEGLISIVLAIGAILDGQ